jgi:nitrogenase molybdenum-iron protein beta chain
MNGIISQPRYSCALAAQQTVLAITGAHPVVHAGPGCSQKVSAFLTMGSGAQGEGYAGGGNVSATNSYEQEVVFGGEKKLHNAIDGALKVMKGDLFVVLTGCTADIVGDDSITVAKRFAEQGYPVVGAETAGFKGNNYYGHNVVVNAIIEQFTGDVTPKVKKGRVNLFSVVPYQNPFWRGDLETLKSLLASIGLEANVLYGYGSNGVSEWKDIPNAEFNLLVSPWVGLDTVKLLEKKYGTPYLHCPIPPVGTIETNKFLRTVGEFAGIEKAAVEKVINREESRFYKYLISAVDFLTEFRNNLPSELYTVADSSYALAYSVYLVNEFGFIPKGVYITDGVADGFKQSIIDAAAQRDGRFGDVFAFEADGGLVQEDIKKKLGNSKKALFVGSGWEKFLAQKTNNLYVFGSLPLPETVILSKSYLGYDGGLRLIEDIYSNMFASRATTSRTQFAIEEE